MQRAPILLTRPKIKKASSSLLSVAAATPLICAQYVALLSPGLVISLLLLTSCTFFKKETLAAPVEKVDENTVRVYKDALQNLKSDKAAIADFPDRLYVTGKAAVTEDRTTVVPSRVIGRIESIYFASGEYVPQGKLLATIYSPDFISAKEEYLQSLRKSKEGQAQDEFSKLTVMSRKKLQIMGLSQEDINEIGKSSEKIQPTSETSSTLDSDAFLKLRAPRSGYIIAKGAALGNTVNVGDTLFTIGDLRKVWFLGDVYPEDLPKIKKDQEVVIQVAGSKEPILGKVSFISPMVDPTTRSIKIRAIMDNPNGVLKADMYVQGSVTLQKRRALVVPITAIVRTPDQDIVFKKIIAKNADNSVLVSVDYKRVPVKIGAEQDGLASIDEGIKEGDEIITDGAWLLDSNLNSAEKSK